MSNISNINPILELIKFNLKIDTFKFRDAFYLKKKKVSPSTSSNAPLLHSLSEAKTLAEAGPNFEASTLRGMRKLTWMSTEILF